MRYILFILINIPSISFCQNTFIFKLNDSTTLREDTLQKMIIPKNAVYNIQTYIIGEMYEDTIEVQQNNKIIFRDTISTYDINGAELPWENNPNFTITIKCRKKYHLVFIINKKKLEFPLKIGYSLLYIILAPSNRINDAKMISASFYYTNTPIRGY